MRSNGNASLLHKLSVEAEHMGCSAANNEFPVLLRPIAERRGITAVEFRPLLVDAVLTVHSSGFRVFFNSNGENPSELKKRYDRENRTQLMPSRVRFSLAHEIAHTLFYKISKGAPEVVKELRSGGKRTALETLERSCNKLAAKLLLPTSMLLAVFLKAKDINPELLFEIADQAGVSIEVLVRRLDEANSILVERYFRGIIILANWNDQELLIQAIAKPKHLSLARELLMMRNGGRMQLVTNDGIIVAPADLLLLSTVDLTIETQQTVSRQRYKVRVKESRRSGSAASYLITFEQTP